MKRLTVFCLSLFLLTGMATADSLDSQTIDMGDFVLNVSTEDVLVEDKATDWLMRTALGIEDAAARYTGQILLTLHPAGDVVLTDRSRLRVQWFADSEFIAALTNPSALATLSEELSKSELSDVLSAFMPDFTVEVDDSQVVGSMTVLDLTYTWDRVLTRQPKTSRLVMALLPASDGGLYLISARGADDAQHKKLRQYVLTMTFPAYEE